MIAAGPGRPGTYAEGEAEPAPVKPPLIPAVPAAAIRIPPAATAFRPPPAIRPRTSALFPLFS